MFSFLSPKLSNHTSSTTSVVTHAAGCPYLGRDTTGPRDTRGGAGGQPGEPCEQQSRKQPQPRQVPWNCPLRATLLASKVASGGCWSQRRSCSWAQVGSAPGISCRCWRQARRKIAHDGHLSPAVFPPRRAQNVPALEKTGKTSLLLLFGGGLTEKRKCVLPCLLNLSLSLSLSLTLFLFFLLPWRHPHCPPHGSMGRRQ